MIGFGCVESGCPREFRHRTDRNAPPHGEIRAQRPFLDEKMVHPCYSYMYCAYYSS